MADKTIKVKVDVETDVEPSIAQLKALKRELKNTAAGTEDFQRLQQQIDDMTDSIKSAKAGAGNFTEVLSGLPGPIGDVGSKISGAVDVAKKFGGLKFTDIKTSFAELGKDLNEAISGLGRLTGITKVYTVINGALAKSFQAVGVSEGAAAAGASALSAALVATGIGALVVGLGLAFNALKELVTGEEAAKRAAEDLNNAIEDQNKLFELNAKSAENRNKVTIARMKAQGATEAEIRKTQIENTKSDYERALAAENEAVDLYNKNLGKGDTESFKKLQENLDKRQQATKDAYATYLETGYNAKADEIKAEEAKNKELAGKAKAASDKRLSERKQELAELKKGLDDARLESLSARGKEEGVVNEKYDKLKALAIKYGEDTKVIEQGRAKELLTIADKYSKEEIDKRTKQLEESFAKEQGLLDLRVAKGELTEKQYQIELYNLRKQYAILNEALGQDEIDSALDARKQFDSQLKAQVQDEINVLNTARTNEIAQLKDDFKNKKITKKQYNEQLIAIGKEYDAKVEEVRKQNQAITQANIKDDFEKGKITQQQYADLTTALFNKSLQKEQADLKAQLDNKQITEEKYAQKSLELARKYSDLTTSLAYETLQKEEADLKTSLDKNEINQSEYNAKILDKRKQFANVIQQQSATEMASQEASLKAALDLRLNNLQTATQTEQDKLKSGLDNKLTELQTALQNQKITEDDFNAQKLAAETEYDSKVLEVKNKFTSDSVSAQTNYDNQITGLKEAALAKNKDLITAETDLSKFQLEEKKKTAEEERGIIALRLQSQIEALDAENQRVEGDYQQDLERLTAKRELIAEAEANDLANTELTEFQKTEIRKKYADERKNITDQEIATEKAAQQAKVELQLAYLDLFSQFGSTLKALAGENKSLQIAGIVIEQAAAIGKIVVNTGIANAKALAASPLTFGQPWIAINTISAGLSIATSIAGAAKAIQQINAVNTNNPSPNGSGAGGSVAGPTAPAPAYAGAPAAQAAPQIQGTTGVNASSQIAQTIGAQKDVVKAYVVSGDVTSQQALDRRTNRAATFSGG